MCAPKSHVSIVHYVTLEKHPDFGNHTTREVYMHLKDNPGRSQVSCFNRLLCYFGQTSQWWESQHKRSTKNRDENYSYSLHSQRYRDVTLAATKEDWRGLSWFDIFSHAGVRNIEESEKRFMLECSTPQLECSTPQNEISLSITVCECKPFPSLVLLI